jgi:hypothetical protein
MDLHWKEVTQTIHCMRSYCESKGSSLQYDRLIIRRKEKFKSETEGRNVDVSVSEGRWDESRLACIESSAGEGAMGTLEEIRVEDPLI